MVNRLANETSPYLQQHQYNPVNWYPWSKEAFQKAEREGKPLFISIGYSACHWCHVMERESFENQKTADLLNKYFVNIKVDREEHPDIDKLYQRYYNSLTGESGGWPLSVWAFPDGLPFFIGTYFPNSFNLRTRTFTSILKEIANSWEEEREDLLEVAINLSRNLDASNKVILSSRAEVKDEIYHKEVTNLKKRFDYTHGGLDGAPKFPRFSTMRFLLQESTKDNRSDLRKFVQYSFHQMCKGGVYDQLGGGIARYAIDKKWLVPHFEKMLYDNAGLLKLGAEIFALTGDPFVKYIIQDTVSFLVRSMRDQSGAFYSAIDAETEGVEGKYYVWTHSQVKSILDPSYWGKDLNLGLTRISIDKPEVLLNKDYKIAKLWYGITRRGNFSDPHGNIKNSNVLSVKTSISSISEKLQLPRSLVTDKINMIKSKLFQEREKRTKPAKDKKIITAWNAMLITALFEVSSKLGITDTVDLAVAALEFILNKLYIKETLFRTIHAENHFGKPKIEGILDDYAYTIQALITAYEHLDDKTYIMKALELQDLVDEKFFDEQDGIYYFNRDNMSIGRLISAMDDSFSSSIGIMVENLYKLGSYTTRKNLKQKGRNISEKLVNSMKQFEGSMSELLISSSFYLDNPTEIVIVKPEDKAFEDEILRKYLPNSLIYRWREGESKTKWEVLENRLNVDQPTVYICHGSKCSLPITSVELLRNELEKITSIPSE